MAHDDASAGTMVPDDDGAAVHPVIGAVRGVMAVRMMVPIAVLDDDPIGKCRAGDEKGDGSSGSEQQFLHFSDFLQQMR